MKISSRLLLILSALVCQQGMAQEVRTPPASTVAVIPAPIFDETTSEPSAPVVKPDFRVEVTQAKRLYVVEAPPMPGLPSVEGVITLTVQSVADPGLPDPPPPAASVLPEDAEHHGRYAEVDGVRVESHFAFVSATVYDSSRTRLVCQGHGGIAVTAWSNIDFNHFSGIAAFEATGANGVTRGYHFLMGIGNEDTGRLRKLAVRREIEREMPEIPVLPDGAPAFVIESENPDPESVRLIEDLHALYRDEGREMAAISAAREKAYEERKAHLLANPPKPKDVTVRFWKRDKSTNLTEGGQP